MLTSSKLEGNVQGFLNDLRANAELQETHGFEDRKVQLRRWIDKIASKLTHIARYVTVVLFI